MSYLVPFKLVRLMRRAALMLLGVTFVAAAGLVVPGTAQAGDLPFWEQADAQKKAATKGYKSSKYSKSKKGYVAKSYKSKSYASNGTKKKLGGYAEATEPKKYKKGVRVASLDGGSYSSGGSLTGGGNIRWAANSGCLDPGLRAVLNAASSYGSITVNSTCRSHSHNRAVGGAPRSKHLTGDAVDFRVHGNASAVYAYLRSSGSVGGLKHYGGGLFHIDNGERRSW